MSGARGLHCGLHSKVNAQGETQLHLAAINGDVNKCQRLFEQGASVSVHDCAGWSPLHEACNHRHSENAEYL